MELTAATGRRIGYARVSTEDQHCDAQRRALRKDGCQRVYEDTMSGMKASRPQLDEALAALRPGDTLVVFKLDRLGRDYVNLGTLVRDLVARDVHLRSLTENLDTASAAGNMMLGIISVFANYERDVIVERTRAGLDAARARGTVFGNPQFRRRDPEAIARLKSTWHDKMVERTRRDSRQWIDVVRTHRPDMPWSRVKRLVEARTSNGMTLTTLMKHVRRLVETGDLSPEVLGRAPMRDNASARSAARRIRDSRPDASLRQIGRELEDLGLLPVRAATWSAESVSLLLRSDQPGQGS